MKSIPVRSIKLDELTAGLPDTFKIRSIGEMLAGKSMKQELHRHDFYFILAVSRGSGLHSIDFTEYPVADGSVFIIRPGQVHQLQLNAGSQGYLLEFAKGFGLLSPGTGPQLLRKASNRNHCRLNKNDLTALFALLEAMLQEYNLKQEGAERVIKAQLEIFLTWYLRYRQHNEYKPAKATPYQYEKLEELMALLEALVHTCKQPAAYADQLNLSPFQLNSITRKLLGKTVMQLIDNQILLEAKRQLLATSKQVTQIAFDLGYEDVSYFIRFFKKLSGYTPEAFRKNFR